MKLTNVEILDASKSLEVLTQQKFPIKLSWKISTAHDSLKVFAEKAQNFLNEIRLKYAIRDEQGNLVQATDAEGNPIENTLKISLDKIDAANKEINDLLNQTVEVSNCELDLNDFPDDFALEPQILSNLKPLFKK